MGDIVIRILILLAFPLTLPVEEPAAQDELEIEEANTLTLGVFERMKCVTADHQAATLKATKKSTLRWSNPVVGRVYGNVFLWTDDTGRPAAAVSIYKAYSPWNSLDIECSSLTTRPLLVTYEGKTIWTPPPSDLKWTKFASAPIPSSKPQTRLIQMRSLVRRFDARVTDSRLDAASEVERELRPLAQPIFRYASPDTGIVDAGMFAFAVGTDPEAFLLLECRADKQGDQAWYYALARMNRDGLEVSLDNEPIWEVKFIETKDMVNPKSPYRTAPAPQSE